MRRAPFPRAAPGTRFYAIGDVHGRRDLLDALLIRIEADMARKACPSTLVFLGDYIDRGPHSAHVLSRLVEVAGRHPTVCLMGNHEALLLDFLSRPESLPDWAALGGLQTVLSYGVVPPLNPGPADAVRVAAALRSAMPATHIALLARLVPCLPIDDFFFVHAGVRPLVPLAEQREADMLWIRDDFLTYTEPFERCIVHGHTPVPRPDLRPNRINLDTGAFATGLLSCVVLEHDTIRVL